MAAEGSQGLRAAQRASLVDQVIGQLSERIGDGTWPVGSKIPPEPVLVERLGVGRNTIREAVRALTHAGMLDSRQGDGTYVRATSELSGAVQRRLRTAELLEILEVRSALEVQAARLAAVRRTAEDLAAVRDALAARARALGSGTHEEFLNADVAFHVAVVEATHNQVMIDFYRDFTAAVRASVDLSGGLPAVPHEPIADAIAAGDPDAAAQATLDCFEHVRRTAT
ncbi:FadR/GntR family transcriptional regulator [Actinocorallia longicatena]